MLGYILDNLKYRLMFTNTAVVSGTFAKLRVDGYSIVLRKANAMDIFETIIIALQLSTILARKRYKDISSSEESVENILYYKDCNHKRKNNEKDILRTQPQPPPPKQQECKMYCSMCCGEDCVHNQQSLVSRQGSTSGNGRNMVGSIPKSIEPGTVIQPPVRGRKKKLNQPLIPPIGGRRDFGFTREHIKNLISQDDDIKKILKDLVKVTMQKVDLVEMINTRRNMVDASADPDSSDEHMDQI